MSLNKSLKSVLTENLLAHDKNGLPIKSKDNKLFPLAVFMDNGVLTITGDDLIDELEALIQSELKKQRESIRKQLPEKKVHPENGLPTCEKQSCSISGFNQAIDQITKILDGGGDE